MAEVLKIRKKKTVERRKKVIGSFEVRDAREHDFFFIDNAFLRDKWLLLLKGAPAAVYFALCRHVDKEQIAFPSVKYLMDETGYHKRQVLSAIQTLELHKLIKVHRTRGDHNLYTLINRKHWTKAVAVRQPERKGLVDKGDPMMKTGMDMPMIDDGPAWIGD